MTLNQLRMLTKIAEEGSVFAAAQALFRTQPAVSVAMKNLEKELGVQILERDQYRATLTDEGMLLYEKAKSILQQVDAIEGLAGHLAVGNEPQLRIAIEFSCPVPVMLEVMQICNDDFPQTQFSFCVENIMGAVEKLELDEAELAITPLLKPDLPFESFSLTQTEMIRVASPEFPLCRGQEDRKLEILREHVQVIVQDSSERPPDASYNLLEGGRRWYVNDHYTKKELIMAGMGWGTLHRHMIENELNDGRLQPLEIENYPLSQVIEIAVARKSGRTHGPIASALWASLQAVAATES